MNRHQERVSAFALVFESYFSDTSIEDLASYAKETEAIPVNGRVKDLAKNISEMKPELDKKIEPYLRQWKIDRISKVALAILEIAIYEILYVEDVDAPIAINEAVEIAKMYAGDDDPAFINGVLGSFLKDIKE